MPRESVTLRPLPIPKGVDVTDEEKVRVLQKATADSLEALARLGRTMGLSQHPYVYRLHACARGAADPRSLADRRAEVQAATDQSWDRPQLRVVR